jgi:hypothetical protein
MSDERTTLTDMPATTMQPSLTEALYAVKTVGQDVAEIRSQVRTMWIAVAVVGVLTVASAGFSFVPRMLSGGGPPGITAGAAGGTSAGTSNGAAPGGASAPSTTGQ